LAWDTAIIDGDAADWCGGVNAAAGRGTMDAPSATISSAAIQRDQQCRRLLMLPVLPTVVSG
jgi:hypothetical protein